MAGNGMIEILEIIWDWIHWICFGTGALIWLFIIYWVSPLNRIRKDETEQEMFDRERNSIYKK